MNNNCGCKCTCGSGNKIVYSCSGGSNVGQLANDLARKISSEKGGAMSCGISLGADLNNFIITAKSAEKNILIDGCKLHCLKKTFERHNIPNILHIVITDFGVNKNKDLFPETELTEEIFNKVKIKI